LVAVTTAAEVPAITISLAEAFIGVDLAVAGTEWEAVSGIGVFGNFIVVRWLFRISQ
jgi:hypothetical protein